jgi:hypothetical protein
MAGNELPPTPTFPDLSTSNATTAVPNCVTLRARLSAERVRSIMTIGLGGMLSTGQVKGMRAKRPMICQHLLDFADAPAATRRGELKAIVGEHCVNPIRDTLDQPTKKIRCDSCPSSADYVR